jgi:hypothetical protein
MIKNFFNKRSKLMALTFILSIIIVILTIPEFIRETIWIREFVESFNEIDSNLTANEIHLALSSSDMINLTSLQMLILNSIFYIAAILNITSYIYNKLEFQFLSIGFFILIILVNFSLFDIVGILFFILLIILHILAYIQQHKLNKAKK